MQQRGWRRAFTGLVAAIGVLALPAVLKAQTGKITGVVTDAASGQPIEGVQVIVQGTGLGAVTQPNGRYFILAVRPGSYTVTARRIGYQSQEQVGVSITIDATREINFRLTQATTQLGTQRIVAEAAPLVERGTASSGGAITAEVINTLPVTDVAGVLQLQQGFLSVPQNTDIISFADSRRNAISGVRIRGGRGGSTQSLIDGIPVNNWVFGDRALDLNTFAVQQIDFLKGGMEPQYGNAISGVLNIATIEGGTQAHGGLEYQTSALAGSLGSRQDELLGQNLYRGFVSGPVPGTANRLRYAASGSYETRANSVYEFDNQVFNFQTFDNGNFPPQQLDLFPGWRAFGFNETRDLFGKLTFLPTANSKFNLSYINYTRTSQPFDAEYRLTGFDPFTAPGVRTLLDSVGLNGFRAYRDVVQSSINANRELWTGSGELRFGRTAAQLRVARFDQERETCNFYQGVCLGRRFAQRGFLDGRFVAPNTSAANAGNITFGTDNFFGGERVTSYVTRADIQSQITDHHNLQAGVFYQRHELDYAEVQNLGNNAVLAVPTLYKAKPYEAAFYLQDRIEYDFITVKLGARFDYGKASGRGFADPQDPTNGTNARDVCEGNAPSLGATTPASYLDPATGIQYTGFAACANSPANAQNRPELLAAATELAARDDFAEAPARTAISPRIQVAFPVTERSQFFANAGRYVQNPLYNNLYQNTGIGAPVGSLCTQDDVKPGTSECAPIIGSDAFAPSYLGNPRLLLEQATTYEVGYAAEFGRAYAVNFVAFNRDETGLSGIRSNKPVNDPGSTYYNISIPTYNVIVNQDYSTSRGIELQFRRRLQNYWGYDVNYSFSKATTNGPSPDLQQQQLTQGDSTPLREVRSEIDQPHVFNASLRFAVGQQVPRFRFGNLLRNSALSVTARAASGLPYTPTNNITGFGPNGRGDVNSERGPATFSIDLLASRDFRVSNVNYGLLLRVANLTDRKNCIQVFPTTGRCDAGVPDQGRGRAGNNVAAIGTSTQVDLPQFIGQRRSIFGGVRVNF